MNIETNNNLIFILLLNVEVGREYIGALKSDGTSDFMQYLDDTPMVFADDNDWESFYYSWDHSTFFQGSKIIIT